MNTWSVGEDVKCPDCGGQNLSLLRPRGFGGNDRTYNNDGLKKVKKEMVPQKKMTINYNNIICKDCK